MKKMCTESVQIAILQALDKELVPSHDGTWLPTIADEAFLTCVAAGPWNWSRRQAVAKEAIDWVHKWEGELHNVLHYDLKYGVFPFEWQHNYVQQMIIYLRINHVSLTNMVVRWLSDKDEWRNHIKEFFHMCDASDKGSKVLWLFVRDFLKLPAFPIDRHVSRNLKELGLPMDSWLMVELCEKAGVDTNKIARGLFSGTLKEE